MDLQQLKETLNKAGFSEESTKVINEILDQAIARGSIKAEEKEKLLGIVDIETEAANIEADALEEVADSLTAFAQEVEQATEQALKETEKAADQATSGQS
ncbi:MAG: hypothetical protein ABIB61_04005 [Candidatus Shapirobacteria bacterium]